MPERKTGIRPKALKALVAAVAAVAVVCAVVIPRSFSKDHDTETGIISPACMAENMQRVMELSGAETAFHRFLQSLPAMLPLLRLPWLTER